MPSTFPNQLECLRLRQRVIRFVPVLLQVLQLFGGCRFVDRIHTAIPFQAGSMVVAINMLQHPRLGKARAKWGVQWGFGWQRAR
jgi:hypothetical protein